MRTEDAIRTPSTSHACTGAVRWRRSLRRSAAVYLCLVVCTHPGLEPVLAQTSPTPGNCTRAQAEAYLDANNVRARILNNGALFYRGEPHVYEVPAHGGVHATYAAGLWVGGFVQGQLRTAGTRFGEWEFWPGPLLDGAVLPNPNDCSEFDRIHEVTAEDLEGYERDGTVTENLADWPWELGAPVVDGDGNPDNYDLAAGDRPELIGHQRLWWVMNDVGNAHLTTETEPLGIEVQASASAAAASIPETVIDNTTLYTYRIVNRTSVSIDSVFIALWNDTDLGNFSDDYVGMDTSVGMAFTYNADNDDDGSQGYGSAPPAFGLTLIEGWPSATDGMDNDYDDLIDEVGEQTGIGHLMYYHGGGGVTEEPFVGSDYYHYMNGVWKDGVPVTVGGYGRGFSTIPTRHFWPGDPVTGAYWSEMNADGLGTPIDPSDRRWILSFGPFNLPPGEHAEFTFAYVWARGQDHLDSVVELRKAALLVQDLYDEAIVHAWKPSEQPPEPRHENTVTRLHPNPASGQATLRYTVSRAAGVLAELFDTWGRRVQTLVSGTKEPGEYTERVDLTGLAPGLYLYRMAIGPAESTGSLVVVR